MLLRPFQCSNHLRIMRAAARNGENRRAASSTLRVRHLYAQPQSETDFAPSAVKCHTSARGTAQGIGSGPCGTAVLEWMKAPSAASHDILRYHRHGLLVALHLDHQLNSSFLAVSDPWLVGQPSLEPCISLRDLGNSTSLDPPPPSSPYHSTLRSHGCGIMAYRCQGEGLELLPCTDLSVPA
jgi:hypothetical protein